MIASLHCITTRIPRRDKINSHISSIISEKENPTKSSDKVVQAKTEDTRLQRTDKRSLDQTQDQYPARREERKQNAFPTITSKHLLYFAFTIAFKSYHPQLNTVTSRITSSHTKQSKMLVSPISSPFILSGPKLPH